MGDNCQNACQDSKKRALLVWMLRTRGLPVGLKDENRDYDASKTGAMKAAAATATATACNPVLHWPRSCARVI